MKHISIHSFKEIMEAENDHANVDFINVCTPAEYQEKHIPGVRNVPLNEISNRVGEFANKNKIFIHCRSGNRGRQAMEKLAELGVKAELINVEGGLLAWDEAGFSTKTLTNRLPIMRQTLIAAGLLIVIGYVLSFVLDSSFIYIGLVVGAGLLFAGITGWCGMSYALARMPWNQ